MLAGGDPIQFNEIKRMGMGDYINKLSIFVDKIVFEQKKAEKTK